MEKYRPRTLRGILHQRDVVEMLTSYLKQHHLPHLLFFGAPGTGKTSAIHAFAQELFGPRNVRSRLMELNASHERNIDIIRTKVKSFANVVTVSEPYAQYPCPAYKIIVLDEADALTPEAQRALRRIIETTSDQTRFCFVCNYVSKIISPIVSRCATFRFDAVPRRLMFTRLQRICAREDMHVDATFLKTLVTHTRGDMRASLNVLQIMQPMACGQHSSARVLSVLNDLFGAVSSEVLTEFVKSLIATKRTRRPAKLARQWARTFIAAGYRLELLLVQLGKQLSSHDAFRATRKDTWFQSMFTLLATAQTQLCQVNMSPAIVLTHTFFVLYILIHQTKYI